MTISATLRHEFTLVFPRFDWRAGLIIAIVLIAAITMLAVPRFAQPEAFHNFADTRAWLGVPNFLDVITNAPFAIAGALGLVNLWRRVRRDRASIVTASIPLMAIDRVCLAGVFIGVGLTSIGSAYYHLAPGNERLFWDRLPMLLTFIGLLVTLIAERVSPKTAAWVLAPFLILGASTLIYWRQTELAGAGDLRPYFLVQGAALASVLLIVLLYPARYLPTKWLMLGLACYAGAIVFEQLDRAVWSAWNIIGVELVSGHTIKHVCAGVGAILIAGVVGSSTRTAHIEYNKGLCSSTA
ncbi:MAG: hypothetical protein H7210_06735 [Pyrinomonadaceae bacterium]|nr:hypothetical protein [Phycisphaerales bacterium]